MAHQMAGKQRKGRNFSADEERSLCRSFLAVSQDPICGNGQRNVAFWNRIAAHFNQSKPRSSPVRPTRSLETKWGQIKHDVGKFCGAYKQVFDCRESGASLDDVVDKSLQFYRDRHPKQQEFAYLHCWHVLKDVPRWWDSPVDVQRRSMEISPRAVMSKRKSPSSPTIASEVGMADERSAEEDEVVVEASPTGFVAANPTGFPPRPTRPQGSKAAKADLVQQKKREKILVSQARATETMAETSLRKANALQDQCAMSLFTMPLEEGMTEEARRYFTLRRQEEIERLERRMRVERRAAELEELEHANLEVSTSRKRAVSVVPFDTPAPSWAPSPTAAVAEETPRNLPVFTGESPNPGVHIVWSRVSCCLLGLVLGCWDFSLWVSRFLQLEFGMCPSGAVEFDQMDEGNKMNPRYTGVASVLLHDSVSNESFPSHFQIGFPNLSFLHTLIVIPRRSRHHVFCALRVEFV
jgi:hypothetical protein